MKKQPRSKSSVRAFDRVALELISVLCRFENSTKCSKIPFDFSIVILTRRNSIRIKALIDLLAILRKRMDRALFLYFFIHEVRLSGVRASISIVHIRKFYKL